VNGKVSFLEKFGNSEIKTSTGAYELDLSLVNDPGRAWRIMHTKSNTWCSAAVVLPDKAARILNVAGWSNDAAYGLRFYTPDGSPGVNGINDWEENPHNLKLQVRWHTHTHSTVKFRCSMSSYSLHVGIRPHLFYLMAVSLLWVGR